MGEAPGRFAFPTGIVVGPGGGIIISDSQNMRIQRFDPDMNFMEAWGQEGPAPGQFSFPMGLAFAANGTLLVADIAAHRVQAFGSFG